MYAEPSPIPGRLADRLRPLYRGFAQQVLRRRALRLAGREADRRCWPSICEFLDIYLVDGLVRLSPGFPGCWARICWPGIQNGLIQFYAAVTALGVAGCSGVLICSSDSDTTALGIDGAVERID